MGPFGQPDVARGLTSSLKSRRVNLIRYATRSWVMRKCVEPGARALQSTQSSRISHSPGGQGSHQQDDSRIRERIARKWHLPHRERAEKCSGGLLYLRCVAPRSDEDHLPGRDYTNCLSKKEEYYKFDDFTKSVANSSSKRRNSSRRNSINTNCDLPSTSRSEVTWNPQAV